MKRHQTYTFRKDKKKNRRGLTVTLIIMASLFMFMLIGWIGFNDWNVQKSYERASNTFIAFFQKEESKLELNDEENEQIEPDKNDNEKDESREEEMPYDEKDKNGVEAMPDDEKNENETDRTNKNEVSDGKKDEGQLEQTKTEGRATEYIEGQKLPEKPTYIQGILIANKRYPLPSSFAPGESKEARAAFNEMSAAALLENINLVAFSTYRSFEYQTTLYKRYVDRDGVEKADRYSARPGYSEHQTGLAFDIGEVNQEQHWASSSFADTKGGKWLAENAHLYGFIMRYPEGKEEITGYMYESWHFRYVGKEIAKDIFESGLTLEEYLNL